MRKIENIKSHLKNNKVTYIACGVTAVVVAGVTYYLVRDASLAKKMTEIAAETAVNNAPVMNNTDCVNPVMNNYLITLIDKSNRARAVGVLGEDGLIDRVFNSISEAAKELGIDKRRISAAVNGLAETAGGKQFVPLDVAS